MFNTSSFMLKISFYNIHCLILDLRSINLRIKEESKDNCIHEYTFSLHLMIQRKEGFYCKYCPIRKTCFSFLHSQQGSHFFLGGGEGVHEFYELFPLFCHLCLCVHVCLCEMLMLVHYWKDICKFWDFISGKNLPNQETLQVDFHFVPDHFFLL